MNTIPPIITTAFLDATTMESTFEDTISDENNTTRITNEYDWPNSTLEPLPLESLDPINVTCSNISQKTYYDLWNTILG